VEFLVAGCSTSVAADVGVTCFLATAAAAAATTTTTTTTTTIVACTF